MARVKGSAITSRVRFVRERAGEHAYRAVRAALSPRSRAHLEAGVLPHAWVPFELFVELNQVIDAQLGAGDLALCREMGRYGAQVNLPTLYRIFYRLGSLPFILRKAARLWEVHYDSGRLEVFAGDGEARLVIADFETPHRAHCLSVLGWAEGAGELSGVRVVDAREVACRTRGDDRCELCLRWQ
ncbi:MAG TPA: hypothetical protein VIL20_25950 [Sandaracinaceae bacterium]